MDTDLKKLVEELVEQGSDAEAPATPMPATEVTELDSEEAWADFQESQAAFDKTFENPSLGTP